MDRSSPLLSFLPNPPTLPSNGYVLSSLSYLSHFLLSPHHPYHSFSSCLSTFPLSLSVCLSVAFHLPLFPLSPLLLSHCYGYVPHCTKAAIDFLLLNNCKREFYVCQVDSETILSIFIFVYHFVLKTLSDLRYKISHFFKY